MCLFQFWFPQGLCLVVGLLCHMIVLFLELKEPAYYFSSGCINLHSHKQYKRVTFSLYPLQQLLFVDFFDNGHSDSWEVIPHCSFDCISLIISDIDYLFMCLLSILLYLFLSVILPNCLNSSRNFMFFFLSFTVISFTLWWFISPSNSTNYNLLL